MTAWKLPRPWLLDNLGFVVVCLLEREGKDGITDLMTILLFSSIFASLEEVSLTMETKLRILDAFSFFLIFIFILFFLPSWVSIEVDQVAGHLFFFFL